MQASEQLMALDADPDDVELQQGLFELVHKIGFSESASRHLLAAGDGCLCGPMGPSGVAADLCHGDGDACHYVGCMNVAILNPDVMLRFTTFNMEENAISNDAWGEE